MIQVGSLVRVLNPEDFLAPYNKKLKDRVGEVTKILRPDHPDPHVSVKWMKKGNRGKEFSFSVRMSYLAEVGPAPIPRPVRP